MKSLVLVFLMVFMCSCTQPSSPQPEEVKFDKVVEQCQAQPELPWCEELP